MLSVYQGVVPPETRALRSQLLAQWHSWHVKSVLYAPLGANPTRALQFLEWIVGRPPDQVTGGISAWYGLSAPTSQGSAAAS